MQKRLVQCFSLLLYLVLALALIWLGVKWILPWSAPFILAFAFAGLLESPVRALVSRGLRRSAAAGILSLVLAVALIWAAVSLTAWGISSVTGYAAKVPELMNSMSEGLSRLEEAFLRYAEAAGEGVGDYMKTALGAVTEFAYALPAKISARALDFLAQAAGRSPDVLLFAVTAGLGTYFISASYPRSTAFLAAQLPEGLLQRLEGLGQDIKSSFGGFLKAQLILMGMTFFLILGAFLLMDVEKAALMALLTALVDALPVFGTGIVLIPWAAYSALLGAYGKAAGLLGLWVAGNLLRSCLQAKLLGDQMGLEPLASLIAVYVGWRVWGVWGMLVFPILLVTLQQLNDKGVIKLWKNI